MGANPFFNVSVPAAAASPSLPGGIPVSRGSPKATELSKSIDVRTPIAFSDAEKALSASLEESQATAAALSPVTVGVITTGQSAITFAGAPATVTLVWKVLGMAIPSLATAVIFPVILSLIVGLLIYWQTEPESGETIKEKVLGIAFALINSFAIAAATLGLSGTISSLPGGK